MQNTITKTVHKVQNGVDVHLQGAIVKNKLEEKISSCDTDDSCECDCSNMKNTIESIEVSGEDGSVILSLRGENLDMQKLTQSIESCDIEKML